jgi:hypothetical protein
MFGRALRTVDRREFQRHPLQSAAEIQIPSGTKRGELSDLSCSGAQVSLQGPPAVGTPALLKWGGREAMGQVVWSCANRCGVRFDRPLPESAVQEKIEGAIRRAAPTAAVSKIPAGKRRSYIFEGERRSQMPQRLADDNNAFVLS